VDVIILLISFGSFKVVLVSFLQCKYILPIKLNFTNKVLGYCGIEKLMVQTASRRWRQAQSHVYLSMEQLFHGASKSLPECLAFTQLRDTRPSVVYNFLQFLWNQWPTRPWPLWKNSVLEGFIEFMQILNHAYVTTIGVHKLLLKMPTSLMSIPKWKIPTLGS
jgi:hypothetical protein